MAAILEVQQKANFKQLILEKKLESLQETLQTKEIALKQLTFSTSDSQRDAATHSSGETVVCSCTNSWLTGDYVIHFIITVVFCKGRAKTDCG